MMSKVPGEEPTWMKEEVPEEWWEESQQMGWGESQIEILEEAQVEVIGSERVDGIDCYVLEVIPDLEQLWQLSHYLHFDEAPDVTEEYLQEIFRSFSVKQWVAKDTYFLTKAEIYIAREFPPEKAGPSTVDIAMVLLSYNHNQSVSIELPPEAEEAIEVLPEDEEVEYEDIVEISCDEFRESNHRSWEFEVEVGDRILVELCSNPTTGYQWYYETTIENVLIEEEYDFEEPDEDVVGASGIEIWTFQAVDRGTTEVHMEYSQPWEGGDKGEWTFSLTVTVQ